MPLSTLRRIEFGDHKNPPYLRHLVDIASALSIPLEELLEEEWLLPTIEGEPAGSPIQLVWAPQRSKAHEIAPTAPMLEKAAQLVRWLNSDSSLAVTDGYKPERSSPTPARTASR